MTGPRAASVALLYPGDRAARDRADPAASRFAALFEALAAAGVTAEPAIYHDDFADEVAAQLRRVQAVLVWCNPIEDGRRRDRLDALLCEVAAAGVLVSANPEAILRLGTKDVLFETRDLPFGSDVHRIDSLAQLESELPQRLRQGAQRREQHDEVALAVCGAPRIPPSVTLGERPRRVGPGGQVTGRLDVVVRVEQHRRRTRWCR